MSLYQYICAKCSEYKQELAKHYLLTKEYFRLQIREHPICKGDQPISKEFLQKIYNIEITTKNKKKYRSKFLKNCKDLMNKLEDDKYVQFTVDTLYSVIPREKIMPDIGTSLLNVVLSPKAKFKILNDIAKKRMTKNASLLMGDVYLFFPELEAAQIARDTKITPDIVSDGLGLFVDTLLSEIESFKTIKIIYKMNTFK
jgi:hypothetical protein